MTYALSWPLQEAVFLLLSADAAVATHVAGRIYDAPPSLEAEAVPDGIYLTIGDERVVDWSTASDQGAAHLLTIAVHAPRRGFAEAKQAAGAISDAMLSGAMTMSRGQVVLVRFVDARTRRAEGDALRRIEMRFRVTAEDTA
jgi:uncharacterized protein DUF3168